MSPRPRSETIGQLGRAAARTGPKLPVVPPPGRDLPPVKERGAVAHWMHGAFAENLGLKFLSMVLAVTVFLLVNTDRDREITARIGVSYTLPDDRVLVSDRIEELRITVKGPWRKLRKFDERQVERVDLDLRNASAGDIRITPDLVHLPAGLSITSISPSTTRVAFDRRVEKLVEVSPMVEGRPAHGYVVAEVKATPATVRVRGAERVLAALSSVRTSDVALGGHTDAFESDAELLLPSGVDLVAAVKPSVHVAIDEELVTRKLPGLVVQIRGDDAAKWVVTPKQIDVTLTGALLAVEKAKAAMTAVVKLAPGDRPREAEVVLDGLPPGIGAKMSPERVKIAPAR